MAHGNATAHTPEDNPMTTPPVSRKNLLSAAIAPAKAVATVEIQEVTMAPGQPAPLHLHPCPTLGVVTRGSIAFQIEGQPVQHLTAGDAFYVTAETGTAAAATLTAMMAGCVFSVRRRVSSGPSKQSFESGNPSAASASAKVSAATGNRSASSRPMPTACEPCPGKRKAIFVDISF